MTTIESPLKIKLLLHCHVSPFLPTGNGSEADRESIQFLLSVGAIRHTDGHDGKDGCYETTDLGDAWVGALRATVLPKAVFVDEMGRVLE